MNINESIKNRSDLKSYFIKNAIPTESDFAELIESGINQREDGLVKVPGAPLSIEASGDATSQKKVINLYADFVQDNPDWVISLNPRQDPAKPETAKAGFSISDVDGNSRLCIDKETGNVGIGTIIPDDQLEVSGYVRLMTDTNPLRFTSSWSDFTGSGSNHAEISNDTGTYKTLMIVGNSSGGKERRVSIWDRLEVNGHLAVNGTGNLEFGATTRQMVNLWNANYGIGVQANTQYFRTDQNFAWYKGGAHDNNALNAGGGVVQMVINNGNVGIGSATPAAKLDVVGDLKVSGKIVTPEGTIRDDNGGWIRTYGNTGWYSQTYHGGWYMQDTTWIRTYGNKSIYHNTGNMRTDGTLQVGNGGGTLSVPNGGNLAYRGNILFANTAGNVGIRTTSPTANFHVNGSARVNSLYIGSEAIKSYMYNRFQVTHGYKATTARGTGALYNDYGHNYADIFPPAGYTMANLLGFVASIAVVHYAGDVNGDDSIWCKWRRQTDRVRVICNNSENRAGSAINYLAIWRK